MKKHSKQKAAKRQRKEDKKARKQKSAMDAVEQRLVQESPTLLQSPELDDQELVLVLEGYDEASLSRAKNLWLLGDWNTLAELDIETLRHHPDRDRFALLTASAHQQLGGHDKARKYTRMALKWGCPPRLVSQVLIAGVHNTLGKVAALKQDNARITRHFEAAVGVGNSRETTLVSHARSVREMAHLGLLPQAAAMVRQGLDATQKIIARPQQQQAQVKVLQTELDLIHGDIVLAQQRQQLFRSPDNSATPFSHSNIPEWLDRLQRLSVSQLGQDLWVLDQSDYKRRGFFVEFGATDGVLLSNSWLLEKEFGWRGICAEPNPKFFVQLSENRSCTISNACIAGDTGREVVFILADAYGGIADYAHADSHADKRDAYIAAGNVIHLKTISLNDFLIQHNAPREIDYLSIDTEGSELEILTAFPFQEWNIRLLSIEHNFTPQRSEIRALLESHGYQCIEKEWDDWYFR